VGEGHIAQGVLLAQAGLAAGLVLVKEFLGHDVVARRVVGLRHELRRDGAAELLLLLASMTTGRGAHRCGGGRRAALGLNSVSDSINYGQQCFARFCVRLKWYFIYDSKSSFITEINSCSG